MPSPAEARRGTGVALCAADAALARREPTLPGLPLVLDADALLERLDTLLPAGVTRPTGARIDYVRYKRATGIVAAVSFQTPLGPRAAYAKAVHSSGRPKLAKARRKAAPADVWPVVVDARAGLAIGAAAADRRLPGAAAVDAPGATVLRYKPERRLVARGSHAGRPALLKAHQPAAARIAATAHRALASTDVAIPQLLRLDAKRGVVAYGWIEGTPLPAADGDAHAAAGSQLAALHRGSPAGLPPGTPVARDLGVAAGAIAALVPALGPRAHALARRLADRPDGGGGGSAPIHGDWSSDQALVTSRGVVIVDLDRARRGDPATDVASWVANEHAAGRTEAEAEPEDVAAALLAGHAAAGGPSAQWRLAEATAGALMRRAVEPFRLRQADWPDAVEQLLATAERQVRSRR